MNTIYKYPLLIAITVFSTLQARDFVVTVQSTEVDINNHVNNAKFVEYLQWGRWHWLRQNGITRDQLKIDDTFLVVVHLDLNFRAEGKEGDRLLVTTKPKRLGTTSFTLTQQVIHHDKVLVEASVTLVAIDQTTHMPRKVPESLVKVLMPKERE